MKTNSSEKSVITILALAVLLFAAACQKNLSQQNDNGTGQSSLKIYLTDDPSLVFDKVFLDIQKIEIKVEDDAQEKHESQHQHDVDDNDRQGDKSGGWKTVAINAGTYDILKFRNGLDTLFATDTFSSTHVLKKLRITLGSSNSVVYKGSSFPLTVKGNDNFIVVKLEESAVNIHAGGVSSIWIDIDAGRSVKKHGNEFELKPSVKLFSKESTGSVEGRVLPAAAAAVVMAINGTDTASARPSSEGEFKFTGLKAGVYSLLYHATANNYVDTIIQGIMVKTKEDSKLPAITLHK